MHFTRTTSLFLVFFGVGMLTLASPVAGAAIVKRQVDAISPILEFLESTVTGITSDLTTAGQSGNATNESVAPQFAALEAALDTASTALTALEIVPLPLAKRQEDSDAVASSVAGIITSITSAVDALSGSPGVDVASFVPSLDASLNQVLRGLETLLAGVLNLVAGLLTDVAALLRRLAFALTLASLFP